MTALVKNGCPSTGTSAVPQTTLVRQSAMRQLGISRQAVWQCDKRGDIEAIHVRNGRKKGLRLKLNSSQSDLFNQAS
jgi:hypothetical protein